MPDTQILPPAQVVWDRQLIWPRRDIGTGLGPMPYNVPAQCLLGQDTLPTERAPGLNNYVGISNRTAGGGVWWLMAGNGSLNLPALGRPFALLSCDAAGNLARGLEGVEMHVGPLGTSLPAGAALPSVERVFWLRLLLAIQTTHAPPLNRTRFLMTPVGDPAAACETPDQLVGVNNAGGFGVRGNGVDGWEYASYTRTGVETTLEVLPFPAHNPSVWNLLEIVRYNHRPGINATLEIYFNGVQIAVRDFVTGLIEPLIQNEWGYRPVINCMGAVAQSLSFALDVRWGRYNTQGIEIQG